MKKTHILSILFSVYALALFVLASQFEIREQTSMNRAFLSGLNLYFQYVWISFLSSAAFLIIAYFIHNKLSFIFIFLAPLLNIATAFVVGLLLTLTLWVAQLKGSMSDFQNIFLTSTISTSVTTLWLLGDMFKTKRGENRNQKTNTM